MSETMPPDEQSVELRAVHTAYIEMGNRLKAARLPNDDFKVLNDQIVKLYAQALKEHREKWEKINAPQPILPNPKPKSTVDLFIDSLTFDELVDGCPLEVARAVAKQIWREKLTVALESFEQTGAEFNLDGIYLTSDWLFESGFDPDGDSFVRRISFDEAMEDLKEELDECGDVERLKRFISAHYAMVHWAQAALDRLQR